MGSLSILFRQCSYPVILRKMLRKLQVHHPPFSFLLRWIQVKFSVLIIFPSSFQVFAYASVSLNHSPLAIQLFQSAQDISEDSCFLFLILSSYFEVVISFKPFNSTGVTSISSNLSNGVSFESQAASSHSPSAPLARNRPKEAVFPISGQLGHRHPPARFVATRPSPDQPMPPLDSTSSCGAAQLLKHDRRPP